MILSVKNIDALCRKMDIDTVEDEIGKYINSTSVSTLSADELPSEINGERQKDPVTFLHAKTSNRVNFSSFEKYKEGGEKDPFGEIGQPGTPIIGGLIQQEPTAKYRPYQVRGYAGLHSLYEEYYRQEPILYEGINEGNNIFAAGKIEFHCPDVPLSQKRAAEQYTEFTNRWFSRMWRGPQYFQRHLGAAKIFGFYGFEIVWTVDHRGRIYPRKFAPREPSTVDRWIMNPRGDELMGVIFQTIPVTSGKDGKRARLPNRINKSSTTRYTLTTQGNLITDFKYLLANINARANNFEGIAYPRPVLHWIKFKQVLAQIAAISAQKYGVPIPVVFADLVGIGNLQADAGIDIDQALDAVASIQATDGAAIRLPTGVDMKMVGAQGVMPQLVELLKYADHMIDRIVSSESAGLSSGAVGSYALASVLDNKMLRTQPGFAAEVLQPINWLVQDIALHHDVHLDCYPQAVWKMDGFADASKWIEDATKLMAGAPLWEWPEDMKKQALYKLDLDPTTFDEFDAPELAPEPVQQFTGMEFPPIEEHKFTPTKYDDINFTPPKDVQEQAQQGLDYRREYGRGGTETGIARARDLSNGSNVSPETIGRMKQFFDRHEKNRVPPTEKTESDGGPTNGWIAWLLWGGDAGRRWASKVMGQMESRDNHSLRAQIHFGCTDHNCTHDHKPEWVTILSQGAHNQNVDRINLRKVETINPIDERGMSAEEIDHQLDKSRDRIARRINPIVSDMQREWRREVRDGRLDPLTAEDVFRSRYRPQLEEVFREESLRVSSDAAKQLLRDYGFTVSRDANMPHRQRLQNALDAVARSSASEVVNRQIGYMLDALSEDLIADEEDPDGGVPKLKQSTLALVAGAVANVSWSAGRDDIVETVTEVAAAQGEPTPQIIAQRTSMLDPNVCEECKLRDFETGARPAIHVVGSNAYYADMPPAHCLGGDRRCRCAYIYTIPAQYEGTMEQIAAGEGFTLPPG